MYNINLKRSSFSPVQIYHNLHNKYYHCKSRLHKDDKPMNSGNKGEMCFRDVDLTLWFILFTKSLLHKLTQLIMCADERMTTVIHRLQMNPESRKVIRDFIRKLHANLVPTGVFGVRRVNMF